MKSSIGFSRPAFSGAAALIVLFCLLLSPALASISVSVTLTNDEGTLTDNTNTNNGRYSGSMILLPYSGFADIPFSAISVGGGRSTDKSENEFSSGTSVANGEATKAVGASVATTNGGFGFTKSAVMSSGGNSLGMSVASGTDSGTLMAEFSNYGSKANNEISVTNGIYSFNAAISPEFLTGKGAGISKDTGLSGFELVKTFQGFGKEGITTADISREQKGESKISFAWIEETTLGLNALTFGEKVRFDPGNNVGLVGSATKLPLSTSAHAVMTFDAVDLKTGKSIFDGVQYIPSSIDGVPSVGAPIYFNPIPAPGVNLVFMQGWVNPFNKLT